MIFYDKKRTIYALCIGIIVIALFFFAGIPLMFLWQKIKIDPFYHFDIEQIQNNIHIFSPWEWSGTFIQTIDQSKKKIIFTLTGSTQEIKSSYNFPINWLIGYDMCYENEYAQTCFWKTK